ncbi:MAG: hypothetical protein AAF191_15695, partial [Verrucomicrobiota bacterium]
STLRALKVLRRPPRPILKSHFLEADFINLRETQPHLADWLEEKATVIFVSRQPEPMLRSLWAFLQIWEAESPPSWDEDFVKTRWLLAREQERAWGSFPRLLSLRFEEILGNPDTSLRQLEEGLGLTAHWRSPLLPKPLRNRWASRGSRLFHRKSPSTAILVPHELPPWNPDWDDLLSHS